MKKTTYILALLSLNTSLFASQYTIQNGDSIYGIAKKHHTTVEFLKASNNLEDATKIKVGAILELPNTDDSIAKLFDNIKETKVAKIESKKYQVDENKSNTAYTTLQEKLGKKYVWGATGPNCFDCSGLTTYTYKQQGISLPRTANAQSHTGLSIERDSLLPGDLVFFDTSRNKTKGVNHVGIYVGNNKFIHASSAKHQVIETSLDSAFYKTSYRGAKRVKS